MRAIWSRWVNGGGGTAKLDRDTRRQLKSLNKQIKQMRNREDSRGEARCYEEIGFLFFHQHHFDDAINNWTESLRVYQEINDRRSMAESYSNIGTAYRLKGDLQKAARFYNKALTLDKEFNKGEGEVTSLHNLGGTLLDSGRFEGSCESYGAALDISREHHLKNWEIESLYRLGTAYAAAHQYGDAFRFYQEGLRAAEADRQLEMMTRCTLGMGECYEFLGEYGQALMCYEDAMTGAQNLENPLLVSWISTRLGWLMFHIGHLKKGKHYAEQAVENLQKGGPQAIEIDLNLLKARIYATRGLIRKAMQMIDDAEAIADRLPYGYYWAKVKLMKAWFEIENKHFEPALGIIIEKRGRFRDGQSLLIDVETALILGRAYRGMQKNDQAFEARESAVVLARRLGIPRYLWRAHHSLGRFYHHRKQFQQARDQYEQAAKWIEKAAARLDPDLRRVFLDVRDRNEVFQDYALLQLTTGHKEFAHRIVNRIGSKSLYEKLKHLLEGNGGV